ncbi:MAG: DUF6922 domain-containing protein [Prolixibacteraceae bacterium]
MTDLIAQLNKAYFWDVDSRLLDDIKSKRLIIERVMKYGNLHEIGLIKRFYGEEDVKQTLFNLNYIDPKTLNFLSILFKVPKNKFKCYTSKQSEGQHWTS